MNRRDFIKGLGVVTAVAVVAPFSLSTTREKPTLLYDDFDGDRDSIYPNVGRGFKTPNFYIDDIDDYYFRLWTGEKVV